MDEAMVATMAAATVVAMVVAKPCEVWPVAAPGGVRCWPGWAGASDMLYRCALRVLDSLPYGWGLRQSCVTCSGRRADLWWKLLICNRSVNISMGSARRRVHHPPVHHTTTDHGPHAVVTTDRTRSLCAEPNLFGWGVVRFRVSRCRA